MGAHLAQEPVSRGTAAVAAERRGRVRVAAQLPLTVKYGDIYETRGEAINFSTGGMFFLLDKHLPLGSPVELVFALPPRMIGREGVWLRCPAEVVRVQLRLPEKKFAVAARIKSYRVFETP
ncbi:MAG TPA: PilZ domain-containing protein [Terriglobales bacterium]|nr:PilZ domain-containing protein [Terriglobales bacterium]